MTGLFVEKEKPR